MKKFAGCFMFLLAALAARAQFSSVATDVSVLRSFTKGSRFWALGQTVQGQYHVDSKTSLYAWICYYSHANFNNNLTAVAHDSAASPQQLDYIAKSSLRYRQLSLGFKHYIKGAYNNETSLSFYSLTGFGLVLAQVSNTYDIPVDTLQYTVPPKAVEGSANVVRLTLDLGLGVETRLGASIYWYTDVRTWIQASSFQSKYLYNNEMPRVLIVSTGLRVLFD